jgi:bifunctional DNase/RNase
MKKIELEIAQISHSIAHTNSFALLLVEKKGVRRLPIVIGGFEAQAIAIGMEQVPQSRPQTHDLFKSIFDQYHLKMIEVVINNLAEGVFYAKLICEGDGKTVEIDSRTSDAIALAVRFEVPIYTYEFIMDQAGIVLEGGTGSDAEKDINQLTEEIKASAAEADYTKLSPTELQDLMQKAIDGEDYEKAARIRDELSKRK